MKKTKAKRSKKSKAKTCGNCSQKTTCKRVRAVFIKPGGGPRVGLVCSYCAESGYLFVPPALRLLGPKPKRVTRSRVIENLREKGKLVDYVRKSSTTEVPVAAVSQTQMEMMLEEAHSHAE